MQENIRRSHWVILVIGLLVPACFIGLDLVQEHARIEAEERQQLATQATVVDANLTRRLVSLNAALDSVRADLPWLLGQQHATEAIEHRLHALVDVMIGTRTLLVVSANGDVIASNHGALIGENVRPGERFELIRRAADPAMLYVSAPFKTPLGIDAISVGKIVTDKQGVFSGVILAILDQEFFKTLMNSVRYSKDMRASVVHGDGKVIYSTDASYDSRKVDLGRQSTSFFYRHIRSGQTANVFAGHVVETDDERLAAFRTIVPPHLPMSKPLVVAISRALPSIYAGWLQQLRIKLALFALLALLASSALVLHQRRHRAFLRVSRAKDRAHAQASLIAGSERFIRTITDAMPEMIAYFDAALHCQFANKAYLDWHAKTSEAVLGATLMDLLGSALFSISQAHVHAALAGESVQFERFLSKPDGSGAHLLVNYIAHADTDGAIIGFIVVATDIKALKIAEAELRLAATVVQNVSESIMVTDARGVIVSVNPAFTDINGYSMQEALGKTPRLLRSQHHPQQFYVDLWQQIVGVGLWRGEIWNRKKSGEVYLGWQTITRIAGPQPSDDRYISVSYDITEAWTSNERFKHQAFHDALTRLPNRLLLGERITRHIALAQRESRQLAVLFLDLDQFKAVNDLLGHAVGDEVLIVVAQKLKGLVRDADTVARLGGDEFVVLLDNPASEAHVELVARRIIEVLGQPMVFDSTHAHIGTSVGIAMYPDDGNSAAELIAQADLAMYAAKEAGRNTLRFAVRPRA